MALIISIIGRAMAELSSQEDPHFEINIIKVPREEGAGCPEPLEGRAGEGSEEGGSE